MMRDLNLTIFNRSALSVKAKKSRRYFGRNWRNYLAILFVLLMSTVTCSSCSFSSGKNTAPPPASDDPGKFGSYRFLNTVSCAPSPFMCVAGDDAGGIMIYKNGQWSSPVSVKNLNNDMIDSISCYSSSLCVGVGGSETPGGYGYAFELINGKLTPLKYVSKYGLDSISCFSQSQCMAIAGGLILLYDHGSWRSTGVVHTRFGLITISCPTRNFCGAISQERFDIMGSNGQWIIVGNHTSLQNDHYLEGISCPVVGYCMVNDSNGKVFKYYDGTLKVSGNVPLPAPIWVPPISCWSIGNCEAITVSGYVIALRSGVWSKPVMMDPNNGPDAVSCVSGGTCMAVDQTGHAFLLSHGKWSKGQLIEADPYG